MKVCSITLKKEPESIKYMYAVPTWFFGIDVLFELLFAIITLILGIYSLKIYSLCSQKQSQLFGIAFIFISISYFIQSIFNFFIISKLGENICTVMKIQSVTSLQITGIYFHMIFFIIGIATLTYTTLKIEHTKVHLLLIIISLASFFVSLNKFYWFYVLSSLLLGFIIHTYAQNYKTHHNIKSLLVFIAFIFLLLAKIQFIFAIDHAFYYVAGHILELGAYILILINLMLIRKK